MKVAKLFFLISGEHETLPVSELKAILEAQGYEHKVLEKLDQVLRLKADSSCVGAVKHRAAFTRSCVLELLNCKAETSKIVRALHSTDLKGVLKKGENFAVRVKRVKRYASEIDRMVLERKLGEIILRKAEKAEVNLKNPDKTFVVILTDGRFVFGVKLAEILPKPFIERRPKEKPFFHPSAMQAKLARCMVNMVKPKTGKLVFDPFCGTGGILVEAAFSGCRVLGSDIKRRMAKGTSRNMVYFKIKPEGILVADARSLPITRVDCVVADPPYGRCSTTVKRTTRQIVEEVLTSVHELLDKGARICMATPKTLKIEHIGTALGYKHLESHFVYVHRSLTREIAVFEKV
jgi:tRNA (guanine10-N2)-dimethyltransferase